MEGPSRLEQYLTGQLTEALLDSSGTFTVARERAVEKLAAFQLPRPGSWILKLIQGVVAGGTPSIRVALRGRESELTFDLSPPWSVEEVEEAFFDPEITAKASLDYFKRGLWNVAVRQQRPFQLALTGWTQALIWTGQELRRIPIGVESQSTLTLSCQAVEGSQRNNPQENAEVLQELHGYAFVCPVPVSLDGRRIDALQAGPDHGYGPSTLPIFVATATASLPRLRVPPGTWEGHVPETVAECQPKSLGRRKVGPRGPCCVAAVLSLHQVKEDGYWKARPVRSHCYWIHHGVVVQVEELNLPPLSCSCALFVSAEGMAADLTGFALMDSEERARRRGRACAAMQALPGCGHSYVNYLFWGGLRNEYHSRMKKWLKWLVMQATGQIVHEPRPDHLGQEHCCDLDTMRQGWRQAAQVRNP